MSRGDRGRSDLGPWLLLFALLGSFSGAAWLTRHPEAAVLERAQGWPVVGPAAEWFRGRYLPRQGAPAEAGAAAGAEVVVVRREEAAGGALDRLRDSEPLPPGERPPGRRPVIWVLPGTVMRAEPSPEARALLDFSSIANTLRLERRGDWFRIRYLGLDGWVYLEGYDESGGPPYGNAPDPPGPLLPRPPDPEELAAARALLGERERTLRLGPYELYTDSRDDDLLAYLGSLAGQIEDVYVERTGRRPVGRPRAALVLYRSELPYRVLQRRSSRLAELHPGGHAASGLAMFYAGERGRQDVGSTLVHELVHFLNRRALGPALPPWLDEGLADDLAIARVGPDGVIRPTQIGGELSKAWDRIGVDGGLAALHQLHATLAGGRLPRLRELLRLDWESFVATPDIRLHYAASAFFVRYLLEGEEGRYASRFRAYLDAVAGGEPATAETLLEHLGDDWETLERGYESWLRELARRSLGDFLKLPPD